MKKLKYIVTISLIISMSSCSNDFVELSPTDRLNAVDFYNTKDDFNTAVIGAYAKLQGQVNLYFELVEWRSDYLNLLSPTAGDQDRYNIVKFQETPDNSILQSAWANYYNGIYRTNLVIENIGVASFDETLKKQYEAEARFIRALTYFNIVRIWGDAPIVLRTITVAESLKLGRSPVDKVYEVIEADLEYAVVNLPASQVLGRATSGAAKALLGKVYLTEKKYPEAITILNQVVGQYTLLPSIASVFSVGNKANTEIIFSIRYNKEIAGEGHGLWFGINDITTTPFTTKLLNAYSLSDSRKAMIDYVSSGNRLVPGKFFDTQNAITTNFGNDYILLRYSDALLMLAEALNEQGYQSAGVAFGYLNDVRVRSNLTAYTAANLPDQASFRTAVLKERFLEFPLEGHRWFDLIRTNTAAAEISSVIGVDIESYQLLYPVPQAEVEKINNPTIFYQNDGY